MATLAQETAKMTFEEFLDWAIREDVRAEWVNGEVEIRVSVSTEHQWIGKVLMKIFMAFLEIKPIGDFFYAEFMMHLPVVPSGRIPDIIFVANENLPHLQKNQLDGPADLVIEIVSPESVKRDRQTKLKEYEKSSVREYWLIDPLKIETIFYQLQTNGKYQIVPTDVNGIYHSKVLDGLWIDVNWLWQKNVPTVASLQAGWQQQTN